MSDVRVRPFGDAAVLIEFGEQPDPRLNAEVHAVARAIQAAPPPGLRNLVPGYVSLLVELEPLEAEFDVLVPLLMARVEEAERAPTDDGRERTIPVVYGGEFGPDLDEVATRVGRSAQEVIAAHTRVVQRVYMIGFSAGFPYLGDLPVEMALPRRDTPRELVPLGSVAIAGRQTGIYSRAMPGGWHIIGRTPVPLFDERREPPTYLAPGDRVRFVAIGGDDWERHSSPAADW